ncbi:MAG: YfhO family protein [Ardenticatenaceae bacterium]|nr:YfhO family protein [Ardenticatenaceae bacterium]
MTPSNPTRWPRYGRFSHLIFPALLLGLILLFFAKMAFSNLILARGDTFLYFYPYWEAAAEALRNGRIPLWNPDLFMGAPLLANSQVGFFYPLNWPLWLLLAPPYAVKASILLHLFIGGWGAYLAGRRALELETAAAGVTAVLFTLGGYLTAQVEHVNQLQGLAWLPWFLVVLASCAGDRDTARWAATAKAAAAFAILFALQLLAGHTQTTFITGVGVLIWGGGLWLSGFAARRTEMALRFRFYVQRLLTRAAPAFVLGAVLALLVTAVQLLPTLELIQHSSREGGLTANEVLSFSLHPLLLARALLPGYGQSLFSEYVAFLPLTALLLAILGGWQWKRWRGALPALLLVLVGLSLALGLFNPLNWLLARLPGFNLFRVPARWLILYTLGVSLLAGLGWQIAQDRWQQQTRPWPQLAPRVQRNLWQVERPLRLGLYLLLGLIMWASVSIILAKFFPTGAEAPYEAPHRATVLLWLAELILAYFWLSGERLRRQGKWGLATVPGAAHAPWLLWMVGTAVLFAASRSQPYNNLTTPEAYFDLRPPITRLLADTQAPGSDHQLPTADSRFLSLSNIFFDPGDQAEIDTIYADQLDEAARYDYTVAIKQKEIIAPNLPLAYGLAAVDGFDGGILPLRLYSQMMTLLLPEGVETRDGRLREYLTAVPAAHWLDLFNARYLITDKTGDQWRAAGEGRDFSLFFDLQHPTTVAAGETMAVGYVPAFEGTAVYIISSDTPGTLLVTAETGAQWPLAAAAVEGDLWRFALPTPDTPTRLTSIAFAAEATPWTVQAVTLANETDGTFLSLVAGQYRLIHSGDVKIYENLDVLPRAFLVEDWQWQPAMAAALNALQQTEFDPTVTAVILGNPTAADIQPAAHEPIADQPVILSYAPEEITIAVTTTTPALLVLTDTFYPGWEAAIDGQAAALQQVDGMFRGVFVPAGEHQVTMVYRPDSFKMGLWLTEIGIGVWLLLVGGTAVSWRKTR